MQKILANELGIKHHILDMSLLNQLAPNALTRDDIEVKDGEKGNCLQLLFLAEIYCLYLLLVF